MRLLATQRFDDTIALLLERCQPGVPLAWQPQAEQDQILAGLMVRLWQEPPTGARFRPRAQMCRQWADEFEQRMMTREPWLVIDPKPYVGDPTYDPLQHPLNCDERLRADPTGLANRIADLAGLDRDRLLLWLFARCIQEFADWPHVAEVARRIAPT